MEGEAKSREIRGLENQITSLHTQMRIQQRQAQELAAEVLNAFEGAAGTGVYMTSVKDVEAAKRAYEHAQDVLA